MIPPRIRDLANYRDEDFRSHLNQIGTLGLQSTLLETIQTQAKSVACLIRDLLVQTDNGYWLNLPDKRKLSEYIPKRYKDEHPEETNEIPLDEADPYRDEYCIADGTAFLFAPQYILTAAHCMCEKGSAHLSQKRINHLRVVFDFKKSPTQEVKREFAKEEVYEIVEVVGHRYHRESPESRHKWEDWAIVRLDRPVEGRSPLGIEMVKDVALGMDVYMLGHPLGMPMMLTRSGTIRKSDGSQFQVDLDACAGNSGSPIFSHDGQQVRGVLAEGWSDYCVVETNKGKRLRALRVIQELIDKQGYDRSQKVTEIAIFKLFLAMPNLSSSMKHVVDNEPLLKVYREKGYLTRFLDKKSFPIEKSYINLTIVGQKDYEHTEKKSRKLDRISGENLFFDQPKSVELSCLFEGNNRVYVEGDAGSGKSTLCHFLAFSWATLEPSERLQALGPWANQYEAVVWIPLREIQTLSIGAKLSDLVQKLYPGFVIDARDRDKTLFILDGFDEVVSLEEVCKNSEEDKRWEIVCSLIDQPHWLMTSRQGLFSERFSMSRRLKNLGFTESNIKSYIQRFSEDFGMAGDDLEKTVLKSDDLKTLAHVPLYLELVCSLWKDNRTALGSLSNPVALYDAMAVYLFRRHIERLQTKPISVANNRVFNRENFQLYRLCLEKIAFMSRRAGSNRVTPTIYQPVFDQEPLNSYSDEKLQDFGKRLFEDLGFLARRGDAKQLFDQDYAFLHPTFEEYFAARYVVSRLESAQTVDENISAAEWLRENCFEKRFEKLIDFTAHLAASEKQLDALTNALLSKNKYENHWSYPLHRAAEFGLEKLTDKLIEKGAKVDDYDNKNEEPIHLAASCGHKKIITLLLSKGAEVDAYDERRWESIHFAAIWGDIEVIKLLVEKGARVNASTYDHLEPIHFAALGGNKEMLEFFLSKGAEIDTRNIEGIQPIHMAAEAGQKDMVELLLDKGAEIDSADSDGEQPIHFAAKGGHREVIELLLCSGAQIDAVNNRGIQPLYIAIQYGHKEVVQLLLANGTKVDAATYDGEHALHLAANMGYKEVVELLLNREAKVDATDKHGRQPLHLAAKNGHKEVVELLLQNGAKVDAPDRFGLQALQLAAENGHKEVVDQLLSTGASFNEGDSATKGSMFPYAPSTSRRSKRSRE